MLDVFLTILSVDHAFAEEFTRGKKNDREITWINFTSSLHYPNIFFILSSPRAALGKYAYFLTLSCISLLLYLWFHYFLIKFLLCRSKKIFFFPTINPTPQIHDPSTTPKKFEMDLAHQNFDEPQFDAQSQAHTMYDHILSILVLVLVTAQCNYTIVIKYRLQTMPNFWTCVS